MAIMRIASVIIYKKLYEDTNLTPELAADRLWDIVLWLNDGNLKRGVTLDNLAEQYKKERNI